MKRAILYALPAIFGMLIALCVPGAWAIFWRV